MFVGIISTFLCKKAWNLQLSKRQSLLSCSSRCVWCCDFPDGLGKEDMCGQTSWCWKKGIGTQPKTFLTHSLWRLLLSLKYPGFAKGGLEEEVGIYPEERLGRRSICRLAGAALCALS